MVDIGAQCQAIAAVGLDADHGRATDGRDRQREPAEICTNVDKQSGLVRHDASRQRDACRFVMTGPENLPADVIVRVYGYDRATDVPDLDPARGQAADQPLEDPDLAWMLKGMTIGDQTTVDQAHAARLRQ